MSNGGNTHSTSGSSDGWDFFVSYTQTDRPWAEWIAWTLEDAGYRVLIQAWDFTPGSNWVRGMDQGVAAAQRTIAVLSAAYTRSVYGAAEWRAAWSADPTGATRRLLVAPVEDCPRPGLLGQVVSFDLFGIAQDTARADLLRAAKLAVSGGRAKPTTAPPFPTSTPAPPPFPPAHPGTGADTTSTPASRLGSSGEMSMEALSEGGDSVENSISGFVAESIVSQVGKIDANQMKYDPTGEVADVKVLSREKPSFFNFSINPRNEYRLTFSVERSGLPIQYHEVICEYSSYKVRFLIDGCEVYDRTFSLVHSRKPTEIFSSAIQGVPVRFRCYMKGPRGIRVSEIHLAGQPVWVIRASAP